ncbi:MAG: UDP-N-acetylmuramoyl-L-alanine--D-glutamate ligase [Dehalococcoidia bacterium]
MQIKSRFSGKNVTVVGLGIEGIDLVRYLTKQGAKVLVSDTRKEKDLAEQIQSISDCSPTLSLGENRSEAMLSSEFIFVSQGVDQNAQFLRTARKNGIEISSMSKLFLQTCPVGITAITGSSGKTTTTSLLDNILAKSKINHLMGGNIGIGLLSLLDDITPDSKVLIELSHTQLETIDISPQLSCVTNVTPNHLDRFSWSSYVDLKRRIFEFQNKEDTVIFNFDNKICREFSNEAIGNVVYTSRKQNLNKDGVYLENQNIYALLQQEKLPIMNIGNIPLPGVHNIENVLAATALALQMGVSNKEINDAIINFEGVPHRLESIAIKSEVLYVNDSIATTPERTIAGINSFTQPIVIILGGRDKNLPLYEMSHLINQRCRSVITFGEASELYAKSIGDINHQNPPTIDQVENVSEAVFTAQKRAQSGDVVLFSPAGTSFDAFHTFEERGFAFTNAVLQIGEEF